MNTMHTQYRARIEGQKGWQYYSLYQILHHIGITPLLTDWCRGTGIKGIDGIPIFEDDIVITMAGYTEYSRGRVIFGSFGAEIYTVTGWFVIDIGGKQVSEAGLTDQYRRIGDIHHNPELMLATQKP